MGKTALVIGATGVVGRALVDQLARAEGVDRVVTLTRRAVAHPSEKVQNYIIDFEKMAESSSFFIADWMFSALGTTRKQAGSIAAQRVVDLDYQYEAARLGAAGGVEHYLLVSSAGANAKSSNAYMKMKGELEEKVQALGFGRVSIFQPSLLLGHREEARLGEKIGSWILPTLCKLPGLRAYRPITGEQVAQKMVAVAQEAGDALAWYRLDEIFLTR